MLESNIQTRLLLAAALVFWTGCQNRETGSWQAAPRPSQASIPQPAVPQFDLGGLSNDGTFYVCYQTKPDPPPLNEPFDVDVFVCNAAKTQLLADVGLTADADMPAHGHGMNTLPKVQALPNGGFSVEGMLFHMSGHWEIYFDISRNGITERAQFDVHLD